MIGSYGENWTETGSIDYDSELMKKNDENKCNRISMSTSGS
jgi:hypothetical protein